MHEAKANGVGEVVVWGSGTPRREFLCSDDAADACVFLMKLSEQQFTQIVSQDENQPLVNIGCGQDITVRELAELIAEVVGFRGRLVFDRSKPDGTPRKLLDVSRLAALGWKPRTSLEEALRETYRDFSGRIERMPQPNVAPAAPH